MLVIRDSVPSTITDSVVLLAPNRKIGNRITSLSNTLSLARAVKEKIKGNKRSGTEPIFSDNENTGTKIYLLSNFAIHEVFPVIGRYYGTENVGTACTFSRTEYQVAVVYSVRECFASVDLSKNMNAKSIIDLSSMFRAICFRNAPDFLIVGIGMRTDKDIGIVQNETQCVVLGDGGKTIPLVNGTKAPLNNTETFVELGERY